MRVDRRWILALATLLALPGVASAQRHGGGNPNQAMAERIANVLYQQGDLEGSRIVIEYGGGVATLQGSVVSQRQRAEAAQLAKTVRGVRRVVDQMEVAGGQASSRVQLAHRWQAEESGPAPMAEMPGSYMANYAHPTAAPARYDLPHFPAYAWPSYAAYPNYASVTYPQQYSPTAWPYIGPFYPYPQVPLGWRKVTMEWDDGWWFLDFKD